MMLIDILGKWGKEKGEDFVFLCGNLGEFLKDLIWW